ncbi:hemerythrin domain-containing protein [uncultured Thiodictyon sp.]|uniref:hemerythrin domain-containing protein n=1 Tax=uncultured Thiodictyon sp. TaxID=1846217 RepID=UPI0025CC244D|nr:hemerythrin domain-containing protein [uncultured Thiodictyon sp.]
MAHEYDGDRRTFLKSAAMASGGLLLTGFAGPSLAGPSSQASQAAKKEGNADEVSPAEDLMREHGVLNRVLLIYDEAMRRIEAGAELSPEPLAKAADLIRRFVEDYHEKLEEEHLFPRFRKANRLVELVDVLVKQHEAGRHLTDQIKQAANAAALKKPEERRKLADSLRAFNRMYRPHEAREDTILFPAFRTIVPPGEYDALGEEFENKEHALFGADGFEKAVDEVATIEKSLGIYELGQFTPQA